MKFEDAVAKCLTQGLRDADVTFRPAQPNGGYYLLASVVSPDFEGLSNHDRQTMMWGRMLDSDLTIEEQMRIEYIFTHTPSEKARLIERDAVAAQTSGEHA